MEAIVSLNELDLDGRGGREAIMECLRGALRDLTGPLFCMELRRGYILSVLMHIVVGCDCSSNLWEEREGMQEEWTQFNL